MGRIFGLLVLGFLLISADVAGPRYPLVGFSSTAMAQGAVKETVVPSSKLPDIKSAKGQKSPVRKSSSELNEALRRIDRLEAQIVEMQSVIGALQTMVQKGVSITPAVRSERPYNPAPPVENQFFDPDRRSDIQDNQRGNRGADDANLKPEYRTDGWGADIRSDAERRRDSMAEEVARGRRVPADANIDPEAPITSRATINGKSPRQLYDTGYNHLMANDYGAAETTFRTFLSNYPKNDLSGNAQYWLGETYFARGDFKTAANEFLKGYKSYKGSQKAPDNLLKLGMSLQRLGQSEAACQTFNELKSRYKSLPGHIARKVGDEMGSAGCKPG